MANYSLVYKENSDYVLQIVNSKEETFEVHDELKWVEGPEVLDEESTSAEYAYLNGEIILKEPPILTYDQSRKLNYPQISEQLDALWHDMSSGLIPGKEKSEWFKMISAIKEQYPKE